MHTRLRKSVTVSVLLIVLLGLYSSVVYWEDDISRSPADQMAPPSLSAPLFTHSGGYYTEPFSLQILASSDEATIYYTLDGSEPTIHSPVYEEPIWIKSRANEPNKLTNIPLNDRDDYLQWKPPLSEVFKATVIRAIAVEGNEVSPIVTHTYFVDEGMASKYDVAVISLAVDEASLFDAESGIFVNDNFLERGIEWERPAHLEFYEPDGTLGFAQQVGIRVHGGVTRQSPTKSLRVYTRSEYGSKQINYRLFPDKDIEEFERFILRYRGTNFKDELQAHLVKHATDIDVQYYRPAVVFINGEFWGLYAIRDRFDDNYIKTHYNIKDIDLLSDLGDVSYGDAQHYEAMIRYIEAIEDKINDPNVFEQINQQMDVDNFRDFTIVQNFIMNVDQPGKNVDFWRSRTIDPHIDKHDGRWRWMLYDLDMGFGSYSGLTMNGFIYNTSLREHGASHVLSGAEMAELMPSLPSFAPATDHIGPERTFLLRALLKNDQYRLDYINRYADLLNTAFKPERVLKEIERMKAEYEPLVEEDALRVGTPDDGYFERVVNTLEAFAQQRPDLVRQHVIDYFPEATGTAKLTLEANEARGTIIVNSIEINEHTIGIDGQAYPWEGTYFTGIPIKVTAVPKPGYRFVGWEGDESSTDDSLNIVLNRDVLLRAIFE